MDRKISLSKLLKSFSQKVKSKFSLTKFILFGSYATGKQKKDSDVDLIIVSPDFKDMSFLQRGARMYDFWNLDYPVDFLCYTPEEFNKLKKQVSIVSHAIKEGIEIK